MGIALINGLLMIWFKESEFILPYAVKIMNNILQVWARSFRVFDNTMIFVNIGSFNTEFTKIKPTENSLGNINNKLNIRVMCNYTIVISDLHISGRTDICEHMRERVGYRCVPI